MDCPALAADAASDPLPQPDTLEAAIARAHPADDPIVKLREIASRLQSGTMDGIAEYKLGKWLDAWLDRHTA
jgi:hypothetical protein